jgi:hypothetical protein
MKGTKLIFSAGLFSMVFIGNNLYGQAAKTTKPPPAKTTRILPDTIKVPEFAVRFGPYTNTLSALPDDIKKLLNTDLIVADQRGQKWTPVAWRFIWNRKEINDDWKTGKRKTSLMPNIVEIDSTGKLPESWQKELQDNLQSGEELIFERIIIEHPESKRKMMAPNLRIKII